MPQTTQAPGTGEAAAGPAPPSVSTPGASLAFVAVVCAIAWMSASQAVAVYTLAFWHYLLYALAYRYGAVPLAVFRRDAVWMKGVSLLSLATAYFAMPPDPASLAIVGAGFLLNALAASALGADRTYYGHEVANLPPLRVSRFPYSLVPHPMLVGNMIAYGGMLLHPGFRDAWWPLASAHVVLNLGLLAMELYVRPLRRSARATRALRSGSWTRLVAPSAGAGAATFVAAGWTGALAPLPAAALGAAVAAYGFTLLLAYTAARPPWAARPYIEPETTP